MQACGTESESAGGQNQIHYDAGVCGTAVRDAVCVMSRDSGAGKLNMNHTDLHTFCPSCGVDYIEHNGLIPTCAELQIAKLNIKRLKMVLADYRNEQLKFNKRETEKMRKL